jgi:hypothetical protein
MSAATEGRKKKRRRWERNSAIQITRVPVRPLKGVTKLMG